MSLIIRLSPTGKRGERKFRIVVKEKRSKRNGTSAESIGWYEKTASGEKKEIQEDRVKYWISQGAKPSPTVRKLLNQ